MGVVWERNHEGGGRANPSHHGKTLNEKMSNLGWFKKKSNALWAWQRPTGNKLPGSSFQMGGKKSGHGEEGSRGRSRLGGREFTANEICLGEQETA